MRNRVIKIVTVFALMVSIKAFAFGQQKQEPNQQKAETARTKEPEYVDISGFKGQIFEIKHADPYNLVSIISLLGSGFKGARIQASREPKLISVRDFPENIAVIAEAIKRLDVPLPAKAQKDRAPNLEMRMYLLIASNKEGASNQYPDELKDVLKQLQGTLNYKNYYLLTPIVQRIWAPSGSRGEGVTTVGDPLFERVVNARYSYAIRQFSREEPFAETKTLLVDNFDFTISGVTSPDTDLLGSARISNQLMIKDGEKVVLGTASLRDKALIVVLSVRVVP